jgi:hypothetical protein
MVSLLSSLKHNGFFGRTWLNAGQPVIRPAYSNSKSKRYLRWLVEDSSTYYLYAFVAFFLAALILI